MSQDLEAAVIAACTKHEKQNSRNLDYRACVYIGTDYFVKYGARRDLELELATQEFIFTHAQQTNAPDAPRIAKIVHHFVDKWTMYLVMERIKLQESPPDLAARIQKAMKWLSEVPLPSNYALGPIGRGPIRHMFFKDFEAPFVFPDVVTLEQYVKRASRLLPHSTQKKLSPVSICGERLMFTQSDMHDSNFGVDEHGRTVLMDFNTIGLLPETFVAFTLCSDDKLRAIAASLGLSGNSNLASMAAICCCLWMASNPTFGMAKELSEN
ncbi:hypothetical protein M404DRAFT_999746 [Pisolithus tinctorius Marx 270]|uniref:Aminoglycoside phosphotransferase domain-containing protein n=1 Tax=Pisolithus tinctorius Marx 270 TaxID=870435 RepID=A0A0C3PC72_PISTI|nr:hypothetical protein M404DRAFT_999746 [Pisolithus tinctorius Marx 270]